MNVFPYKTTINSKHLYCCYLTIYSGKILPPFYLGSTSVEKIRQGYHGSISSKKWTKKYQNELKNHPELFKTIILKTTYTRSMSLAIELYIQKKNNVVKSKFFFNESLASKNGMFGRDVSGKNNPGYGKNPFCNRTPEQMIETKQKCSNASKKRKPINPFKDKTKEEMIEIGSKISAKCKGENNSFFGKKHTEKTKEELKKPKSKLAKKNMKNAAVKKMKNMKNTHCKYCCRNGKEQQMIQWHGEKCALNTSNPENKIGHFSINYLECPFCSTKKSMFESLPNHMNSCKFNPNKKKTTCIYCNKTVDNGNYARFHGINCKLNDSFWEEW